MLYFDEVEGQITIQTRCKHLNIQKYLMYTNLSSRTSFYSPTDLRHSHHEQFHASNPTVSDAAVQPSTTQNNLTVQKSLYNVIIQLYLYCSSMS